MLRADKKDYAICSRSGCGPLFGNYGSGYDILVDDNCNANTNSRTHFGAGHGDRTYANHANIAHFFTGSEHFKVNEIEVFEISD
jgi:hypothetical protein